MESAVQLSIVMPCHNEEEIIETVVRDYSREVVSKFKDAEIIVVDDCSQDNTGDVLRRLEQELPELKALKTATNGGHGKAIRLAYESARGEWVFQVDSDNQFQAREFWNLYEHKDDSDFVLGVRRVRRDPMDRLALSRSVRTMIYLLFGVRILDANCPFRLFRRSTLRALLELIPKDALAPNIMLAIAAKQRGARMKEVEVTHAARETGKVSIVNLKLYRFALTGLWQLMTFRKYGSPPR